MKYIVLAGVVALTPLVALAHSDSDHTVRQSGTGITQSGVLSHKEMHSIGFALSKLTVAQRDELKSLVRGYVAKATSSTGSLHDNHGLHLSLGKLTPTQRVELSQIIRNYFASKGISLASLKSDLEIKREEVKKLKDAKKEEMKKAREELKKKRTEWKKKIKDAHK